MENDLQEIFKLYLKQWKWFVLSVLVCFAFAFFYLRYAVPQYQVAAKIHVLEDAGSGTGGFEVFQDLGMFSNGNTKIEDEIRILNSRSNFIAVVEDLKLNRSVFSVGNIKDTELYEKSPILMNAIGDDSIQKIISGSAEFFVTILSENTFSYVEAEGMPEKRMTFGENIKTPVIDLTITPDMAYLKRYINKKLRVNISSVESVVNNYQSRINISPADELSNIINISLVDPVQNKAKNIINTLVEKYNYNAAQDKKQVADKTSNFIKARIDTLYTDLSGVDQTAQDFKSDRGLTDIASQANINLNVGAANQQELMNSTTQLQIASSMKDLVDEQNGYEVLPSNVGISDGTIANTTARYNELVSERNRLLKSSTEKSPIIQALDQQLNGLKNTMKSSLNSLTNNLSLQVNSLNTQKSRINSQIYSAPKNERLFRDIQRQQQTTESLYLYLLQKSEESQITLASSTPKSKVIDEAYTTNILPVAPKSKIIYLASLILGFILPFGLIYGHNLLDGKVHNKIALEKIIGNIPVLAEIPQIGSKEKALVENQDRSVLAESLRILRTNLDYIIKSKKGEGKKNLIFITSSVSGEGKTFISSNLAMIFANTGKKVLLIGADIRNPKLYTFFSKNKDASQIGKKAKRDASTGLTEYLYDTDVNSSDIINSMLVHENTIDVIFSGKIPPNPTELLMSGRMKDLFEEMSHEYDYVIVDTAPLMVVTDTLIISEYADQILYVTKAGVTERKVLEFPLKLQAENKLTGLSFIVNGVKSSELGYGGKYGYGYGKTVKKWWKFS